MNTQELPDLYQSNGLDFHPDGEIEVRLAHLAELKANYKQLDEAAKQAKSSHDAYQAQLFEELRDRGVKSVSTDNGRFDCKATIYANVNDMEAFTAWADARDLTDEFVKDAPEKARLNEFVRDCIDSGQELPDGVNWYERQYISITKAK